MKLNVIVKDIAKNLLLVLFGLLLAVLAIELYLRVIDNPFGFRIKSHSLNLPVATTYKIHNTKIPKLEEFIVHKKNSLGFRGPDPPANFEDYLTIITVGGSTTESFYLSEGQTWTDKLGLKLEDNFTNIWINNAGFEGMSTFGHIVLMQDDIIQLKPKVVLFLIGINDQGRDDLTQQDRDVLRAPNPATSVTEYFLNASEFVIFVQNFIRYTRTQSWSVGHSAVDFETLPVLEMSERDMFHRVDYHHQHYLKPYQARVERLVVIARDNNIEPVLITQPAVYGDIEDPTTGVNFANRQFGDANGKVQWEILELYNEVTRQVGTDHNVTVIDLANKMPKDSYYYYDFLHFTEAGSERVAEIIYSELCPFLAANYNQYVMKNC